MLPGLSLQEGEAFQFFRTRTTVKLPGIFGSDFWQSLVLQLSLREPAVLHAVIALAATHRRGVTAGQLRRPFPPLEHVGSVMDPNERLALQQYNKAISHLRCHLESGEAQSLRVTLASCVVFTCIELLKGDIETSQAHFRSGWRLLRQINVAPRPTWDSADEHLSEAFTRISIQPPAFDQGSEYADMTLPGKRNRPSSPFPPIFSSMKEARRHLDWLLHDIHLLSAEANAIALTDNGQVPPRLVHRQRHLQRSASSWLRALLTSTPHIRARCPDNENAIRLGEPLLRLYHRMASIMVATSLRRTDETIFDAHTPDFAAVLETTMELWAKAGDLLPSQVGGDIGFTADMGFIPPLYYTALKCRVPRLRRRAVRYLALAPHREGLWDATLAVAVARKVFELEERDLYSGVAGIGFADDEGPATSAPLDNLPLVPGEARLNHVRLLLPPGVGGLPAGTAALVCKRHVVGRGWETRRVEFCV